MYFVLYFTLLFIYLCVMQSEFSYFATDDSATYVKVMITLDPVLTSTPNVVEEISLANMLPEDKALGKSYV